MKDYTPDRKRRGKHYHCFTLRMFNRIIKSIIRTFKGGNLEETEKKGKQNKSKSIFSVGRRKTAVANVMIKEGEGKITINGIALNKYFTRISDQVTLRRPLEILRDGRIAHPRRSRLEYLLDVLRRHRPRQGRVLQGLGREPDQCS